MHTERRRTKPPQVHSTSCNRHFQNACAHSPVRGSEVKQCIGWRILTQGHRSWCRVWITIAAIACAIVVARHRSRLLLLLLANPKTLEPSTTFPYSFPDFLGLRCYHQLYPIFCPFVIKVRASVLWMGHLASAISPALLAGAEHPKGLRSCYFCYWFKLVFDLYTSSLISTKMDVTKTFTSNPTTTDMGRI